MSTPTLRQVEADLERLAKMGPPLLEAARWTWPLAYSRGAGEPVPRVAGGDVATPTEAAAAASSHVRNEVARAGVLVNRAVLLLEAATGCLARAQDLADARPRSRRTPGGPPLVSAEELAAVRAAKARRDAARPAGVGHGES